MNWNKISTTLALALLVMAGLATGCDKIEDLIKFKFHDSAEIVIPSQTVISTGFLEIPTPEVETSSKQAFENNNTDAKYVKEAKLTELTLTITEPESQNFSFLNEIHIYISAPNQEEVLVATKTDISDTVGKELSLDVTGINLAPYIKGDSYSLRTETKIDKVTSQEITIKAQMGFSVTADVL